MLQPLGNSPLACYSEKRSRLRPLRCYAHELCHIPAPRPARALPQRCVGESLPSKAGLGPSFLCQQNAAEMRKERRYMALSSLRWERLSVGPYSYPTTPSLVASSTAKTWIRQSTTKQKKKLNETARGHRAGMAAGESHTATSRLGPIWPPVGRAIRPPVGWVPYGHQ